MSTFPRKSTVSAAALALALVHAAPAMADAAADDAGGNTIVVTAQRANQTHVEHGASLGALGNQDAMSTPFAIKAYDSTLILNQQPTTLGEVLDNDPSVRTTYGYGNASEQYVIRGFPLYGEDIAIDGLFGITPRQLQSPELYDQVQILNGASAFLFGAAPGGSALGGTVNLMPKRAGERPLTRITANYISGSQFGGSFDIGRRFGADGALGIRINGAGRWGDDAVDGEYRASQVLGLGADWRSGGFKLSIDLGYQRQKVSHMRPMVQLAYGNTAVPVVPDDAAINYGQPWNYTTLRDVFGLAKAEYSFSKDLSIYAQAGAKDSKEDGKYQSLYITDSATGAGYSTGLLVPRRDRNTAEQAGLRFSPSFAGITNQISIGISAIQQVERAAYGFGPYFATADNLTNLYHPVAVPEPDFTFFASSNVADPLPVTRIRQFSFFASDTIGLLDDKVLITAGLRRQQIKVYSYSYFGGAQTSASNDWATSPVVGVVVKPSEHVSLYANRIQGFQMGPTAPYNATNANQVYPPFTATQYEAGGKISYPRFNASLAIYTTRLPVGILTLNPDGTQTFAMNGEQRNRGVELSMDGQPVDGLKLIGGITYTDAKLLHTSNGAQDGNFAPGIPKFAANLSAEWDLPFVHGATLTGRVMHTSSEWFDTANLAKIPEWTRFDVGARYVTAFAATPVTFRFGVDNVAGKSYWASAYGTFGGQLVQGAPRTYKASATVTF